MKKLVLTLIGLVLFGLAYAQEYEPSVDELLQYKDSVIVLQGSMILLQDSVITAQDFVIVEFRYEDSAKNSGKNKITPSLWTAIAFVLFFASLLFVFGYLYAMTKKTKK